MFRADIVSPEFTSVMQKKRNVLLYVLNYNVNRGDAFRCSASGTTCTFVWEFVSGLWSTNFPRSCAVSLKGLQRCCLQLSLFF